MGDASEWLPVYLTIGGLACGLGVLLLVSLEPTRTNLCFAFFYITVGLSVATPVPLVDKVDRMDPGWAARLQGQFEVATIVIAVFYLGSLLATSQASPRAARVVTWAMRAGAALAVWHSLTTFLFPAQRLDDFQLSTLDSSAWERSGFWIFATFWITAAIVFMIGYLTVARQHLDSAEAGRALCSLAGTPLLISFTFLPPSIGTVTCAAGMLVVLLGQFRYLTAQGLRGAFMSRFLSPQVTELVRLKGLAHVMQPKDVEITVVACDLRGFTAYAEAVPSRTVVDLLDEYYDAVGAAVAEHGGTIKDYAGDGVLILVGAPINREDHATVGLHLARRIGELVKPVLARRASGPHPLGLGAGVATGWVTVGALGSSLRMEYMAVGTAVNLAARLCSAALDGEILASHSTVELAQCDDVEARGAIQLKGLSAEQQVYAVLA
jgi:adenylate cyclase